MRILTGLGAMLILSSADSAQESAIPRHCQVTSGHHVYEAELTCPLGGERFTALRLGTHSTYGRYLDWRLVSYLALPVPMPICPGNGFPIDRAVDEFTPELIATRQEAIERPEYQALLGEHTSYYLYARMLELTGEDPDQVWWYYLSASWEAEICDYEVYELYAQTALDRIANRLEGMPADDEYFRVLNLLTANLMRRLGDLEGAAAASRSFQAEHADLMSEGWDAVFARLDEAIAAGDTSNLEINPQD